MTDELKHPSGDEMHDAEGGTDAPPAPDGTDGTDEESNPWLKEGADSPDAADIADPGEQR